MDKYIVIMNLGRTCSLTTALNLLPACQPHNSGCFMSFLALHLTAGISQFLTEIVNYHTHIFPIY